MDGIGRLIRLFTWKRFLKLLLFMTLLLAAYELTHWIVEVLNFDIRPSNEDMVHRLVMTASILYALLLALPFVPGAEIGLALLTTLGAPIAFLVYLCTVVGLTISFLVGRFIPLEALASTAKTVGLHRIAGLLDTIAPLNQRERLEFLTRNAPSDILPLFINFRYAGLGILFNMPGNFLIGGGGGIGMIAGASGLFSFFGFLLTVLIAVSPVPIAVSIMGAGFLK